MKIEKNCCKFLMRSGEIRSLGPQAGKLAFDHHTGFSKKRNDFEGLRKTAHCVDKLTSCIEKLIRKRRSVIIYRRYRTDGWMNLLRRKMRDRIERSTSPENHHQHGLNNTARTLLWG